jgi:hypothetical protein
MRQHGNGASWWQRAGGSEWGHTANMSAPRGTCCGLLNTLPPAWLRGSRVDTASSVGLSGSMMVHKMGASLVSMQVKVSFVHGRSGWRPGIEAVGRCCNMHHCCCVAPRADRALLQVCMMQVCRQRGLT